MMRRMGIWLMSMQGQRGPSSFRSIATVLCMAVMGLLSQPLGAAPTEFTGLVVARHDLLVSPGVAGAVTRVGVEVGQRVKPGQLLVQIDDRAQELEALRRKQIFEDLSELKAARDRFRILSPLFQDSRRAFQAGGSVSRDELSRLELDWSAAQARVEQIEIQKKRERIEYELAEQERSQRRLTAPVAGVVTRIDIEIGEWAKPGEPVLQLVDADLCYLKVNVTPGALRGLKADQAIEVRFDPLLQLRPVQGRLSFISPATDPASGLTELRVSFQNPGWRVPPGVKGAIVLNDVGAIR
jgi:RND family efflux transporter MFP subunit